MSNSEYLRLESEIQETTGADKNNKTSYTRAHGATLSDLFPRKIS